MTRKTVIAVLAVLLAALSATPAMAKSGGKGHKCPPGVTDANYCSEENESGVKSKEKAGPSVNDKTFKVSFHCEQKPACSGTLALDITSGSGTETVGTAHYSMKFHQAKVIVFHLNKLGQETLEKTGTLNATIVSISDGVRSVVQKVKVKGHKVKGHKGKGHKGKKGH